MLSALTKLFGSRNERLVKGYSRAVRASASLEAKFAARSDTELRAKTGEFRERLAGGARLDELQPEAFALVREAARRVLGMRHFDVQLVGGLALHEGKIAEMRTGEGKTLVATLPAYLNALTGEGVHVVTVNEYLAQRDADWMGPVYRFLGLSVGVIKSQQDPIEKRAAYACDITFGTNNEFGFDYLRDNLAFRLEDRVQRRLAYAIVDEVDSILIDEARTPLIISGPAEESTEIYQRVNQLVPRLQRQESEDGPGDYSVDEKGKQVHLTEDGHERVEQLMVEAGLLREGESLYDATNVRHMHHLNAALRAHALYRRDVEYIVRNGEVIIVDEFTGRTMIGRRWSDGLHQAVEAKENVRVREENQTVASITFQNYFRLYKKLAGMTGTAATEADEFMEIYRLEVVEIPTNMPVARVDEDDEVYRTAEEKYKGIIREIEEAAKRGQPILVGTTSIEKSEYLAELLRKDGLTQIDFESRDALEPLYEAARKGGAVKHFAVLNARFHEQEAFIVAEAGVPGAITIATNMAGRGTDIQLGGNSKMRVQQETAGLEGEARAAREREILGEIERFKARAIAAGGLYVLGTERHESRRIDNQLRGRSGRQGDPGRSKFYLSLQDDLMRIFGSDRMDGMLSRLGLKEDEAIVHPWINKAIERAQAKVEARNFDMRKNILKYDNVMNDQRKVVFEQRRDFMAQDSVRETIDEMRHGVVDDIVARGIPQNAYAEQWDVAGLKEDVSRLLNLDLPVDEWVKEEGIADEEIRERLRKAADEGYAQRVEANSTDVMTYIEKQVLLQSLDHLWREHLVTLDHLRQVIGWRGYAQRDPLNEYKSEAFELFNGLVGHLREQVTGHLMRIEVVFQEPQQPEGLPPMFAQHLDPATGENEFGLAAAQALAFGAAPSRTDDGDTALAERRNPADPSSWGKVGRNEPCPCGSGKKFKHCHGRYVA